MTILDLAERLNGRVLVPTDKEIAAFYAGDFLSRVMGNAPHGAAWLTVMSNLNVAGVAVLAEIVVIVLCEGVSAPDELVARCETEGIGLVTTDKPLFEACISVGK